MTTHDAQRRPYKRLGDVIAARRSHLQMTQEDLAAAMNRLLREQNDSITQSGISYWERGVNAPTGGKLKVLAQVLNTDAATLAALRADIDVDLADDQPVAAGSHGLDDLTPAQREEVLRFADYIRQRDNL